MATTTTEAFDTLTYVSARAAKAHAKALQANTRDDLKYAQWLIGSAWDAMHHVDGTRTHPSLVSLARKQLRTADRAIADRTAALA